jgi:hypothetical protein
MKTCVYFSKARAAVTRQREDNFAAIIDDLSAASDTGNAPPRRIITLSNHY